MAYVVLIVLLMSTLPRGTSDPGAILPGAAVVATVIVGMQMISQLYIPGKVADASDLYGGLGVVVVALGWLFILGRSLSFAFSVDAARLERFGSLSTPIFALPVVRLLPRHSRRIRGTSPSRPRSTERATVATCHNRRNDRPTPDDAADSSDGHSPLEFL